MILRSFRVHIAAFVFILLSYSINAQPGFVKTDFGNGGYVDVNLIDTIYSGIFSGGISTTDVNGNIYISGLSNSNLRVIIKLTPEGKPDLVFGNKGRLEISTTLQETSFSGLSLQVDSDQNIYLLGKIDNILSVTKYNRLGKLDFSFGTKGKLILNLNKVNAFSKDRNNNFYLSGDNSNDPYVVNPYVAKFNSSGELDNSFGTNGISYLTFDGAYGNPTLRDIVVDSDGYLYINAQYYNSASIVKIDQTGAFVKAFGTNGVVSLPALWFSKNITLDSQGRILIHHDNSYSSLNTTINTLYRYLPSGLPDPTFGQNGSFDISLPAYTDARLNNMSIDTHNNIYLVGTGNTTNPTDYKCLIVKINSTNQTFDSSFDSDGIMNFTYNAVKSIDNIAVNANGSFFVAGSRNTNDGNHLAEIALINANGTINNSFNYHILNANSLDRIAEAALDNTGNLFLYGNKINSYQALVSLTPDGNYNQAFGLSGKDIYTTDSAQGYCIAIEKNGNIYRAGVLASNIIAKTDKKGNLINNFGNNGTFSYIFNGTNTIPFDLLFDQDSSLLVFSNSIDKTSVIITKVTRSGNLDISYGNHGSLVIATNTSILGQKAIIDINGNIYISGKSGISDIFITKISNQSINTLFGINGFAISILPQPYITYPTCSALSFDSNNNLVAAYYYGNSLNGLHSLLMKLSSIGELIPEFGNSGLVTFNFSNWGVMDLLLDKNDNIFLFGNTSPNGNTFAAVKTNALGNVDVSYGNNGLAIVASGQYIGVKHDIIKSIAYLYGNINNDIRVVCIQLEKSNFNTIAGTVFKDADASCSKQSTEVGIQTMSIVAQPGNNYANTDASGSYALKVDTGTYTYTVKQLLNPIQQQLYVNTCKDSYNIPLTGSEKIVSNIDFADKLNPTTCPLLYVDVQNTVRRRCYRGLTKIKYANYGTASESNVTIVVTYPEHNIPKSSTPVWQSRSNSILTYNIGTLNPGQEGFITITDSVSCVSESILGLTQCIKVEITPVRNCVVPSIWDHSEIKITQTCLSDSSVFNIKNIGSGDMDTERNFNVFVNDTIIYSAPFLLKSNESLSISYPANGKSIRVAAEQHTAFPFPSNPSVATQSCNAATIVNSVRTPLTNLPQDDRSFYTAYSCLPIIGSFDPNHKSVIPSGYGTKNYVNKKDKLTYTIQFQNVGTDTAFKVVVIDTLDINLNIETLLVESSSHPFTYTLSGRGKAVLTFSFDPIVLTDSTSNVLKSQGFISYSIYPNADISEGTSISNKAHIFFDYNSPIITNETMLTIKDEYYQDLSKGNTVSVRTATENTTSTKMSSSANTLIYPNPAKEYICIRSSQVDLKNIRISNITGQTCIDENISGNESVIKTTTLSPGIYFYLLTDKNGVTSQGKIIIE